jgi:hypothetical protein
LKFRIPEGPEKAEAGDKIRGDAFKAQVLQDKLQRYLDEIDLEGVAAAIAGGAIVDATHIRQVAQHFGDEHVGLYSLLLASGEVYIADRVCRGDRLVELMGYHSPLNSVLMSSHVNRWERGDVSTREVSMITDNPNPALLLSLNNVVGGRYQSTILMRAISLMLLTYRAETVRLQCRQLPANRSVDEEVVEVIKRRDVVRLNEDRKGLGILVGLTNDNEGDRIYDVPALMAVGRSGEGKAPFGRRHSQMDKDKGGKKISIYSLFKEISETTGTYSDVYTF